MSFTIPYWSIEIGILPQFGIGILSGPTTALTGFLSHFDICTSRPDCKAISASSPVIPLALAPARTSFSITVVAAADGLIPSPFAANLIIGDSRVMIVSIMDFILGGETTNLDAESEAP